MNMRVIYYDVSFIFETEEKEILVITVFSVRFSKSHVGDLCTKAKYTYIFSFKARKCGIFHSKIFLIEVRISLRKQMNKINII